MPEKITVDTLVSTTELAAVLGLSVRRVQQLIQDGTLPTASKGKLLLADSVKRYIKTVSLDDMTAAERKSEASRRQSEAILKASKATVARLSAQELQGKMHRSEDVAAMTEDLIYSIRSLILAVPGRVAKDTAIATTPAETAEIVRKELCYVLTEISRYHYDPKNYEARVRERMDWDVTDDAEDSDE